MKQLSMVKSTRYLPAGQEKTGFDCHLCTRYVLRYLHSPFEAYERSFNLYRFQLELPCVPSRHDVQIEKRRAPSARLQVTSVWAYECSPAKCIVAPGPGILPVWADSSRHWLHHPHVVGPVVGAVRKKAVISRMIYRSIARGDHLKWKFW